MSVEAGLPLRPGSGRVARPHRHRGEPAGSDPQSPSVRLPLELEARHHRGNRPHSHDKLDQSHTGGGSSDMAGGTDRTDETTDLPPAADISVVEVHKRLQAANDLHAEEIRRVLAAHGVFSANLMSSPGAGKTSLLEATLDHLRGTLRVAIIEGDIETTADADRLAPYGIPVVQINTGPFGGDCHLAAPLVARAVERLDLDQLDVLIVENVGNLVCPAEFDIGEDRKVVLLSVTEGEDKPLKYPLMFHEASLAVITKTDLLPHLDVDLDLIKANIRRVNPAVPVLMVSTKTGEGVADWVGWLQVGLAAKRGVTLSQ